MGEKYSMKGIQYDPHDLSKNSLLGFSLFERNRFPMIMDSNHCILYDFPIPDECVRLILLPNLLEMSMIQITDPIVFIVTVLTAPHCLHANLVVINKPEKRVDVFDPIGKSSNSEFGEERKLQERILRAFCCNAHFQFYGETMEAGIAKYSEREARGVRGLTREDLSERIYPRRLMIMDMVFCKFDMAFDAFVVKHGNCVNRSRRRHL
jgi:hypothetical protein